MIVSFGSKIAREIYDGILGRQAKKIPITLHGKIRRLFDQLDAAENINDLRAPPGNRLESLKGNYSGKWSIRVNNQWRIIFSWKGKSVFDVDIVDYH
jgi:proteic killer suppression protein